jgi:hypothetical protein
MRPSAAAAERPPAPGRLVVRLTGEVAEEELVSVIGLAGVIWLWGNGLLTYQLPLLGRPLERIPEVFAAQVLPWLDARWSRR